MHRHIGQLSKRIRQASTSPPLANAPGRSNRPTRRADAVLREGPVRPRKLGHVNRLLARTGRRVGGDFRWLAYVASSRQLGQYGSSQVGNGAWLSAPGTGWQTVDPAEVSDDTVDLQALAIALTPGYRATAEDRGIEVIEGARARR